MHVAVGADCGEDAFWEAQLDKLVTVFVNVKIGKRLVERHSNAAGGPPAVNRVPGPDGSDRVETCHVIQ